MWLDVQQMNLKSATRAAFSVTLCDMQPCGHGGVCTVVSLVPYGCICTAGYDGKDYLVVDMPVDNQGKDKESGLNRSHGLLVAVPVVILLLLSSPGPKCR